MFVSFLLCDSVSCQELVALERSCHNSHSELRRYLDHTISTHGDMHRGFQESGLCEGSIVKGAEEEHEHISAATSMDVNTHIMSTLCTRRGMIWTTSWTRTGEDKGWKRLKAYTIADTIDHAMKFTKMARRATPSSR